MRDRMIRSISDGKEIKGDEETFSAKLNSRLRANLKLTFGALSLDVRL